MLSWHAWETSLDYANNSLAVHWGNANILHLILFSVWKVVMLRIWGGSTLGKVISISNSIFDIFNISRPDFIMFFGWTVPFYFRSQCSTWSHSAKLGAWSWKSRIHDVILEPHMGLQSSIHIKDHKIHLTLSYKLNYEAKSSRVVISLF